jgi:ankyrin repeat protein
LLAFLLQQQVAIDAQDIGGDTALHSACAHNAAQCAALLLEHGANWHLPNYRNTLPDQLCADPDLSALFGAWAACQAMLGAIDQSAPDLDAPAPRRCRL